MNQITNKYMKQIFQNVSGNVRRFHQVMCNLAQIKPETVNPSSLYWKAKKVLQEMDRLRKHKDKRPYTELCNNEFVFPKSSLRRKATRTIEENTSNKKPKAVNSSERIIANLQHQILKLKQKIRTIGVYRLNEKLKRKQQTIDRLNEQVKILKQTDNEPHNKRLVEKGVQCNTMRGIIANLKQEIDFLHMECEKEGGNPKPAEENDQEPLLSFREDTRGRPYNRNLRELYYYLRSINLPLHHLDDIIRKVLSIVKFEVDELPSAKTASLFTSELGIVARQQLSEELSSENVTMHRDATTKKGRHFYGVEFSTGEKTLTAGVREVCDGKGETYLAASKEIVGDIESLSDSVKSSDNLPVGILKNVTCFMTDRSATEQKVNNLIMKETENSNKEFHSFKCAVHPLLQFADCCNKDISRLETEMNISIDTSSKGESSTHFLLRCISKLFYKDGSGDPLLTSTYLKNLGIKRIPIMNFRGNRFNVLFFNAAGTFFIRNHILNYLKSSKTSLNFTQNFIVLALENEGIICIVRALGIIFKIITEPYYKAACGDVETAIEMGSIYERLEELLSECSTNPTLLLSDSIRLFYGPDPQPSTDGDIYSCLFKTSDNDERTAYILQCFSQSLKTKCKQLFKDFIGPSKYSNPDLSTIESCKSCPPNNICVERLMAKVDNALKSAPTCTTNSMESTILYRSNNTSRWLNEKSESEKEDIIMKARSENITYLKEVKRRKEELQKQHLQIIQEREKAVKSKKEKKEAELRSAIEEKENEGIFENKDAIDNELMKIPSKKERVSFLKKQINLNKTLYSFDSQDRSLFFFSKKGKQFEVPQLVDNLLKIIEKRKSKTDVKDNNLSMKSKTDVKDINLSMLQNKPQTLVGKYFRHTWSDNDTDVEWNGKIISYKRAYFQVKYWLEPVENTEDIEDNDMFELTKEEIKTDIIHGTFTFID